MSTLVAVDPGLKGCGVAVFMDGTLIKASYVKAYQGAVPPRALLAAYAVCDDLPYERHDMACEIPQIYQGSKQKGDPNDLVQLALVVGAIAGRTMDLTKVRFYLPREWKGTVNADVMTARIQARLTALELTRIERVGVTLDHNTIDAVGIGLHHLGRLQPKRVIAR